MKIHGVDEVGYIVYSCTVEVYCECVYTHLPWSLLQMKIYGADEVGYIVYSCTVELYCVYTCVSIEHVFAPVNSLINSGFFSDFCQILSPSIGRWQDIML
jgi:hypothetical protein